MRKLIHLIRYRIDPSYRKACDKAIRWGKLMAVCDSILEK
jgi:hypothetical protein